VEKDSMGAEREEMQTVLGMPAIVASREMKQVMSLVEKVAQTCASVLILGESGCGKELVARALHYFSLRCTKPWVDVNCGALPEHLVESELFGFEKGAFSGADQPKPGLFEMANNGTLFLDEIGELEPRMQVKLLRVLDGVPHARLGGVKKISVDVRVIAATNQDLEQSIKQGRFRSDLFHRLNQVNIRVPALRQRLEDIAPLARFFLAQHNPAARFADDALDSLCKYHWPGNIRELRNVVTQAVVAAQCDVITVRDLPEAIRHAKCAPISLPAGNLEQMERTMILQALGQTGGHQSKAAEILGISRRTLSRKLKQFGQMYEAEAVAAQ
jgi:DNA-binding NtrC family response regulator